MSGDVAYELLRFRTRDGDETTVYLTRHPLPATRLSVICFPEPTRLDHWCATSSGPACTRSPVTALLFERR